MPGRYRSIILFQAAFDTHPQVWYGTIPYCMVVPTAIPYQLLYRLHRIESGEITITCDNDGVIDGCKNENLDPSISPKRSVRACHRLLHMIPIKVHLVYVSGHQDTYGTGQVSLLERLNCQTNEQAKAYLDEILLTKRRSTRWCDQ